MALGDSTAVLKDLSWGLAAFALGLALSLSSYATLYKLLNLSEF